MADNYSSHAQGLTSPPDDYVPVTPSDSTDLADVSRALYITGLGNIEVITKRGNTRVIPIVVVPTYLLGRFTRVKATNTTISSPSSNIFNCT